MLKNLLNKLVSQAGVKSEMPLVNSEKVQKISNLNYRTFFESSQDGIIILDAKTAKIIEVNPYIRKVLGFTDSELIGKEFWDIKIFGNLEESKAAFIKLQTLGYIRYKDLLVKTKEGRNLDVEIIGNIFTSDNIDLVRLNIRDISNRIKIEENLKLQTLALEQANKSLEDNKLAMLNVLEDLEDIKNKTEIEKVQYHAILISIGEGLIAVDNQRKVLLINKAGEEMLGWTMKELVGRDITSLPMVDKEGAIITLEKRPTQMSLVTGQMVNKTSYFVRKDNTKFPIAINVTPIKLNNQVIGAVDIFRDITQELEIDRSKSEFVFIASHQLRTPLGIVKWYIEALTGDEFFKNAPENIKDYIKEIYESNERVLALVRELLTVSRIEQGKVRNSPELINIYELTKKVINNIKLLAIKNNIEILLDLKYPDFPNILLDSLRYQEILENLLTNALKYNKPSGKIIVKIDKVDSNILISIEDTGFGMNKYELENIFKKFYRSDKAVSSNPGGSGLGLYVVKSFVEGWGGKISVNSIEGKGSTFTLSIPMILETKS